MQDFPLQTPPGNYNPSWLRKNRLWLVLLAVTAASMYGCAWVVITLGRQAPTTLSVNVVASDEAPVKASPGKLHYKVGKRDQASSQEFELRNLSATSIKVEFSLLAQGYTYHAGDLGLVNRSGPEEPVEVWVQGPIKLTEEVYSVRFAMEALSGLTPEGTIAAKAVARFRLTATSDIDQNEDEHSLILAISVRPDTR